MYFTKTTVEKVKSGPDITKESVAQASVYVVVFLYEGEKIAIEFRNPNFYTASPLYNSFGCYNGMMARALALKRGKIQCLATIVEKFKEASL